MADPACPRALRWLPEAEAGRRWTGLAGRVEAFLVRHRQRLVWVHLAMFLVFVGLILVPPFLPEPAEGAGPLDHLTPFANAALWGVWFPLVFLSVIVTGRSWCGLMCPMGAASEWANRKGPQRAIPGWLAWPGTPVVSFILVTILGQTVGVRDHPEAALDIFGGTMLLAVVVGFVYGRSKRAWCRHMCPIGLLLGVFSRLGAVQFAPKRPKEGGEGYTEKGPCPTLIDVNRKTESRHCIECFRCVTPNARGGLFLRLRKPGEEVEAIRRHNPNLAEVLFLFLGTGVALGGFLWLVLPLYTRLRQTVGVWFIEHGWTWVGESGPAWLMAVHPERREVFVWLDFLMIAGFMTAVMLGLALALAAATGVSAWLSGRLGGTGDGRARFIELGYQYAPVAMVSLVVGLGGMLFDGLRPLGAGDAAVGAAKGLAVLAAWVWSLHLGNRILAAQGLPLRRRWTPLIPGAMGSVLVALLWWPAVVGL